VTLGHFERKEKFTGENRRNKPKIIGGFHGDL